MMFDTMMTSTTMFDATQILTLGLDASAGAGASAGTMASKITQLYPEIAVFVTACVVMMLGLSNDRGRRQLCTIVSIVGLLVALVILHQTRAGTATPLPNLALWGRVLACLVGVLLVLLQSGTVDREIEAEVDKGKAFDAGRAMRGEYSSFVLFSLMGLMLCAGSDDLVFLFLALELTSLPTYVMAALSTSRNKSMEAGVKYFFLGAMGAAMFLFGFALIYGGTGFTRFAAIHDCVTRQVMVDGGVNTLTMAGVLISIVGVLFKVAAVPMHFYTPDVYQGASSTVSGFLAFVPKAAGFFALMLLCSLVGWRFGQTGTGLPEALHTLLWVVAALTMTVGNVLAVVQTSVKRILAYSSIAHTGYMLTGLIAGPGKAGEGFATNGLAAIWFYLLAYGVTTIGAFAVVASLEKRGADGQVDEADSIDDFRGLIHSRPLLGWLLVISSVGLMGLPPLLGFFGKLPLFGASIRAGENVMVVILAINSAIAAFYYLRLAYAAFLDKPESAPNASKVMDSPFVARKIAGALSMACVIGLVLIGTLLGQLAELAGDYHGARGTPAQRAGEPVKVVEPVKAAAEQTGEAESDIQAKPPVATSENVAAQS